LAVLACLGLYGWYYWQEGKAFALARETSAAAPNPQASLRAWQQFLLVFPKGRHADEARRAHEKAAKAVLALFGMAELFEVPAAEKDVHGNPIRKGTDEKSGYPLEIRHKGIGMYLVYVPPGTFEMGSPSEEKGRQDDEQQHTVTLTRGSYMGKYEVTQAEWAAVMRNNPSIFKIDGNPVESVSWVDCLRFVNTLNERFGTPEKAKFALPTEAQWEYACRAGTNTRFYWGDDESMAGRYENVYVARSKWGLLIREPARAVFRLLGRDYVPAGLAPFPVGSFRPNGFGLYDMARNVCEWCQDWYAGHGAGKVTDPTGPTNGTKRVIRGGYGYLPRSALRFGERLDQAHAELGVRLVVVLAELR
jgi:formylglycine-generating enzyme required for sulfatase activity